MTEDCPAYDRERQMCLVHPGDCEFSLADADAALALRTPEVRNPDTSTDAMSGQDPGPSDEIDDFDFTLQTSEKRTTIAQPRPAQLPRQGR